MEWQFKDALVTRYLSYFNLDPNVPKVAKLMTKQTKLILSGCSSESYVFMLNFPSEEFSG